MIYTVSSGTLNPTQLNPTTALPLSSLLHRPSSTFTAVCYGTLSRSVGHRFLSVLLRIYVVAHCRVVPFD